MTATSYYSRCALVFWLCDPLPELSERAVDPQTFAQRHDYLEELWRVHPEAVGIDNLEYQHGLIP